MTPQPQALAAALILTGLTLGSSLPGQAAAPAASAAKEANGSPRKPALTDTAAQPGNDSADQPVGAKATLAQQARSWEDRGRSDFAAAAWRKLLTVEPGNTDALYGLALAQVNLGQTQAAAAPMGELVRRRPDHPGLRKLERHIAQGSTDAGLIKEARRLASAGQYDAAARVYELLLSDRTPQGPIALEYYQTLGGTASGWEPARAGLERLARSEPADAPYALALARHLSYREPSRRDALHQLATLARSEQPGGKVAGPQLSPEQRQDAREAWRQSLLWLDAREADQALYRQFLEGGDDAGVRARLASLQQSTDEGRRAADARDPAARGRRSAFDALGSGDLAAATERFQRVLKEKPHDADALGGLGVVRLREGKLAEARDLLSKGAAASGGAASPWQKGLQSADFRIALQQADLALAQRQPQQALEHARHATQLDPQDGAGAASQGAALLELGQPRQAEAQFRRALELTPGSEAAWRGLLRALHAQGRSDAAAQLVDALDDDAAKRYGGRGVVTAEHLRLSADTVRQRGDTAGAQTDLEQALQLDPQAPWIRLALAQLYLGRGQEAQARSLMDELQPIAPREADAWWARAQWQSDLQEPQAGLAALDHIAPAQRQPEMARLHRRLRVAALLARAQGLSAQGQSGSALASLQQAQSAAGNDLDLLPGIAAAYAEAGQGTRAQQLLRGALLQDRGAGRPGTSLPLQLQYAQLLQAAGQDGELASLLTQIQGQPMSAAQREQFDGLRVGATLRRVDQLREGGDTAEAYEVLAPQLAQRPTDSRLKLALARLHASVGDNDETLQTLDEVLLADPDNLDAWLSAAAIASSLREHDYALGALQRAETIAPSDSRVLAQYSRHYRARGELTRAAQYMRAAIASQRPIGSTAGSRAASETTWGRPLSADNPFAARGATRTGSNNPAESPADLRARRLPPLPGVVSPLAPQDSGPKTIPSSEDWLRGSRALRENTAPLDWPNAASGSDEFARPAQNGVSTNLTSPLQSRFATKHAPVPADIGALASETNSATAATITVAARQSVADMRRQELMPPDETWTADYPTTADVGTALGLADTGNALSAYDPPLDSRGQLGPRHARATDSTSPRQVRLMSAIAPTTDIPAYQLAQAGKRLPPGVSDGMSEPAAPMTRRGPAPSQSLRDELADIVAERGSREVEGAAALRWRNGEGGMSQLVELRSPVSLQMPLGDVGKLQLRVTPTLIDAGTSSTDAEAASRLGSQSLGGVPDGINVSAAGVGLRLGLSGHRWSADLGTTPIGFRLLNVVGGVQFSGDFTPQLGYGIELQRRAVTDSVLSYAGMRDPRTGTVWGGVTATSLGGSLQWKDGDIKLGSYADIQAVLGTGVHSNEKFEMGASAIWQISDDAQQRTEFGAQIGYQHYTHNLRFFTLGQGGYFSPQHQLTLSVPFKAVGHDNRVNWAISAAPGLNAWREDASAYFPTDPAAQRQLQTRVTLGQSTVASYPSRSSFGLSLNLQGGAEYALSSRLLVGSRLSLDSASQYTQLGASLYLRLRLDNDAAPQRVLIEPAPRHD